MKNYGDRSSEAITVTPSATLFNPNTGEFEEASRDLVREREQNRARLEEQFAELQMQVAEWEGLAREALKGLRENAEHGIAIERAIAALRRLKRESYEATARVDQAEQKAEAQAKRTQTLENLVQRAQADAVRLLSQQGAGSKAQAMADRFSRVLTDWENVHRLLDGLEVPRDREDEDRMETRIRRLIAMMMRDQVVESFGKEVG